MYRARFRIGKLGLARPFGFLFRRLKLGAEQPAAGDLSARLDIRAGDEVEGLADRFNRIAVKIQKSHDTLESNVDARTKDLNEALPLQTATADGLEIISRSVFDTLVASAVELCITDNGAICVRGGEAFR